MTPGKMMISGTNSFKTRGMKATLFGLPARFFASKCSLNNSLDSYTRNKSDDHQSGNKVSKGRTEFLLPITR